MQEVKIQCLSIRQDKTTYQFSANLALLKKKLRLVLHGNVTARRQRGDNIAVDSQKNNDNNSNNKTAHQDEKEYRLGYS